jgi:hypothetical protein
LQERLKLLQQGLEGVLRRCLIGGGCRVAEQGLQPVDALAQIGDDEGRKNGQVARRRNDSASLESRPGRRRVVRRRRRQTRLP